MPAVNLKSNKLELNVGDDNIYDCIDSYLQRHLELSIIYFLFIPHQYTSI